MKDPKALASTGGPNPYYTTFNTYDATTGNLLSTADAEGIKTEYTYEPADQGNVSTQKVTDTAHGNTIVSRTEYDYANGVLVEERNLDVTGAVLRKTHFVNGIHGVTERKTWRTPAPSEPQEELITRYVYNANGQLWKTFDPDSTTVFSETVYNDAGQPWKTRDKSGRETVHDYDDMGRLVKTTYPGGSFEETTYLPEGQRATFKDRMGNVTQYCYDAGGRLTKTRPPQPGPLPDPPCSAGAVTENVYDDGGRLEEAIDAEGNSTEYEYYASGRRKKVIDPENAPLNKFTLFEYDANGNLQFVTDPKGEVTEYQYDKANRRTKTKPPIVGSEPQREATPAYSRRTRTETDLAGKVTAFENDELGQLIKVTDANGKDTMYGYDEVGNRISQTDAKGRLTRFEHDKMGRETKRTLPGGDFETKTYTIDGSLDLHTDFNGHTTDYNYDTVTGRLAERKYLAPGPTMPDVAFTYYPDGRRETVTVGTAATLYDYDLRRRLKLLQYPDGRKLEYLYDHNGNRTSLTATLGARVLETTFTYDGNNRLDHVVDPEGRIYDHGYDPNGNRETLDYPNDAHTQYQYDEQNHLTDLTTTRSGTTIQSYAFTLYPAGNRHTITEPGPVVVTRTYVYDDLYRLTSETVTGGPHQYVKGFTYDDVGNRETQTTTGGPTPPPGAISYGYDDRDRLMTETGVTGGYGYDANGNLTDKADGATDYAWDRDNRLTTVTLPDGTTVSNAYDADGNRVQTTTTPPGGPAAVTNYLVDTSGSLSHVVAETDAAGALTAYYVRGDDLLAVMRPTGPTTWATKCVHADGIGSIRKLTNESGAVTDTYTYTAFGEPLSHDGANPDPQPYAFAGEPLDPNVGFQYHRARWMDPSTARFEGMDQFPGVIGDPSTLHRYAYAAMDPSNKADPTGKFLGGMVGVVTILAVLAGVSFLMYRQAAPRSQRPLATEVFSIGFTWPTTFSIGNDTMTSDEIDLVKMWADITVRSAFSGLAVVPTEGSATNEMRVVNRSLGDYAGSTLLWQFASEIGYDTLSERALAYAPDRTDRREIAAGIGRGIGATAAHEFAHQLQLPIHTPFRDTYDYHTSDRFSQYYGQLTWSPAVHRLLEERTGY